MMLFQKVLSGLFLCLIGGVSSQLISVENDGVTLTVTLENAALRLTLKHDNVEKLAAQIGVALPLDNITSCIGLQNCIAIEDARLHVTSHLSNGFEVLWIATNTSKEFRDCYDLGNNTHWYGGPERFYQYWPIEKISLNDYSYITKEDNWTAIAEPYWLNSLGAYVYVDQKVPLFIDQNIYKENAVCFIARADNPYRERSRVLLNYTVAALSDSREAHLHAVNTFLGKPSGHPALDMFRRPIWSTWARYKKNVTDEVVLEFGQEIVDNGYEDGQLEIDDFWETCYGSLEFDKEKFSDINNTVAKLKEQGFRVTLWTHPFIGVDCTEYTEIGLANNFFVKNESGNVLTKWWNSLSEDDAQYLDFSNGEVREWFTERLASLQQNHGIDSFKFDAGETSWAPQVPVLNGDVEEAPNSLTADYVRTCASFGGMIEVRTGYRTQDLPVFVRMIDKDSTWGSNNGLRTLVTTLLQMNMNGYTMVLPDMVGGNGYYGAPNEELYIRWLQANTFMPAIQFSYVPWDFDNATVHEITKSFVDLHESYADFIEAAMEASISDGIPVNAPLWWVDPSYDEALAADDQFLLGEDIIVAPVLDEGVTKRDVVLPNGTWVDGNNGTVYEGRQVLKNYPAPLEKLPYFIRQGSSAGKNTSFGIMFVIVLVSYLC